MDNSATIVQNAVRMKQSRMKLLKTKQNEMAKKLIEKFKPKNDVSSSHLCLEQKALDKELNPIRKEAYQAKLRQDSIDVIKEEQAKQNRLNSFKEFVSKTSPIYLVDSSIKVQRD